MDKVELRSLIYSVLRSQPKTQFNGVIGRLRNLSTDYSSDDDLMVHEILWELLVQGVLAPGMNASSTELPFIHVTEYGERCLEAGDFIPHDPDGYLQRLQMRAGRPLDGVILAYVEASLATFLGGHYLAAAELLGVATERCVDLLTHAYEQSLPEGPNRQGFSAAVNKAGRDLTNRVALLRTALLSLQLPAEQKEGLDVLLSGLFTILRHSRDSTGRPTGHPVSREVAHGNLLLFAPYCQRVYQVLDHLQPLEMDDLAEETPSAPLAAKTPPVEPAPTTDEGLIG